MAINPISFSGYAVGLPTAGAALPAGPTPSTVADTAAVNVDVKQPRGIKTFTAQSGDLYRVGTLFAITPPAGTASSKLTYNVVLRGGGQLTLDGNAVDPNTKTSFTSDEFARLAFSAGASDSDIAVSVSTGSVSSDAVQVTAKTGSQRSLEALPALYSGDPLALLAFGANLTAGSNPASRPTLGAAGNFTALSGDLYRVANLVSATGPNGAAISSYSLAVRGGGQLILDGATVDPATKTSFIPDEFQRLQFQAGSTPSDFLFSAQSGTVTAPAIGFTASVGATDFDRTINADAARYGTGGYGLIGFSAKIQQSPNAKSNPTVATVGNFQAESGSAYRVATLFKANAPTAGGSIDRFEVAVKGGGTLTLDGTAIDPETRTSFTADEFQRLQFTAGGTDSKLVVAAKSGTTSSAAVEITAETAAATSFNALAAKYATDPYAELAFSANLQSSFTYNSAKAPSLTSVGNFTGNATDTYRVASLFTATAQGGSAITAYSAIAQGTGTLTLDGATIDPATKTSFTADEFQRLVFTPGAGTAKLAVAAQAGSVSSPAIEIQASVGNLSANAARAVYNQDAYSLIAFSAALQSSSGLSGAPSLSTVGNFTAVQNQNYRVASLYGGTAGSSPITSYNVGLRGDGALYLDGVAVDSTTKTSFTPDEFERLSFVAGASSSDLIVAAQAGTRSSEALQITASTTGQTSLNAGVATYGGDPFLLLGFGAGLTRGTNAAARPAIGAAGSLLNPTLTAAQAAGAIGASTRTGAVSLANANELGIANLFGASQTGGVVKVGATASTQATIVELVSELNAGIGGRISSSDAQRGQSFGVVAYDAAGKLT